jgi:hypothetical protein
MYCATVFATHFCVPSDASADFDLVVPPSQLKVKGPLVYHGRRSATKSGRMLLGAAARAAVGDVEQLVI